MACYCRLFLWLDVWSCFAFEEWSLWVYACIELPKMFACVAWLGRACGVQEFSGLETYWEFFKGRALGLFRLEKLVVVSLRLVEFWQSFGRGRVTREGKVLRIRSLEFGWGRFAWTLGLCTEAVFAWGKLTWVVHGFSWMCVQEVPCFMCDLILLLWICIGISSFAELGWLIITCFVFAWQLEH